MALSAERGRMATRSPVPHLAYSVSELVQTGIAGRSKIYEMIDDGRLTAVKIGGATKVLATEVERFLATLPAVPVKAQAKT
jgi:excisionase family DNA binding protein